jgi:hypothetical protein
MGQKEIRRTGQRIVDLYRVTFQRQRVGRNNKNINKGLFRGQSRRFIR